MTTKVDRAALESRRSGRSMVEPKRLTDRSSRMIARRERDAQWDFMERVVREGIVWMCPWDKYKKHGPRCPGICASSRFVPEGDAWKCAQCGRVIAEIPDDHVYVFGLIGSNEFFHWIESHKDWWKRGRWSEKRCARSIRVTAAGRKALKNRHLYDMEPIHGGMVEPGYVVKPWPSKLGHKRTPHRAANPARRKAAERKLP